MDLENCVILGPADFFLCSAIALACGLTNYGRALLGLVGKISVTDFDVYDSLLLKGALNALLFETNLSARLSSLRAFEMVLF